MKHHEGASPDLGCVHQPHLSFKSKASLHVKLSILPSLFVALLSNAHGQDQPSDDSFGDSFDAPSEQAPAAPTPTRRSRQREGKGETRPDSGLGNSRSSRGSTRNLDPEDIIVDEPPIFDIYTHWLSFSFGFFRVLGPVEGSNFYAGAGGRYGITIAKRLIFASSSVQDSIVPEFGLFYYRVAEYETAEDQYSLVPMTIGGRYNLMFSESFGIFIYGVLYKTFIFETINATDTARDNLSAPSFVGGIGSVIELGPMWAFRIDMGLDFVGGGLMLRF